MKTSELHSTILLREGNSVLVHFDEGIVWHWYPSEEELKSAEESLKRFNPAMSQRLDGDSHEIMLSAEARAALDGVFAADWTTDRDREKTRRTVVELAEELRQDPLAGEVLESLSNSVRCLAKSPLKLFYLISDADQAVHIIDVHGPKLAATAAP